MEEKKDLLKNDQAKTSFEINFEFIKTILESIKKTPIENFPNMLGVFDYNINDCKNIYDDFEYEVEYFDNQTALLRNELDLAYLYEKITELEQFELDQILLELIYLSIEFVSKIQFLKNEKNL